MPPTGKDTMSTRLRHVLMQELGALRLEPIEKRIRAVLNGETLIDSRRAVLVWEPGRVVPGYAVPSDDISGEIRPVTTTDVDESAAGVTPGDGSPCGDEDAREPASRFATHTAAGEPVTIRGRDDGRQATGLRPADSDLADHLILDFDSFDAWYEEDEPNVAHPRDPFHRIDILHSSRHVQIQIAGETVADSRRPYLLFETLLPVRYYLPAEDVRTDLLRASSSRTFCAYKGKASYWSVGEERDVVWAYPEPLREAAEIAGRIAFFNERVDIVVDGEKLERPRTQWSPADPAEDVGGGGD